MDANGVTSDLKRISIEKRTLAFADQFVHDKTLALTNSMDFYTLANLLRNLDDVKDKLDVLSVYRMDLDMNYAHEMLNILSRFQEVVLDECGGTSLNTVLSGILNEDKVQKLTISSQTWNPEVDTVFKSGLQTSNLMELSLTIDIPRERAEYLSAGINTSHLERIRFNQCEIHVDSVDVLSDCFRTNQGIVVIELEHCFLQDEEVANLLRALREHPTLKELSFRMNYASDDAITAASDLLRSTNTLERLDFAQQNPGFIDLGQLAEGVSSNTTLIHLNLTENYLSHRHIPVLIQCLVTNCTLRELNLEDCDIKESGLSALIESLGNFKGLTHLWLKRNNFRGAPNQAALSSSIERNKVLQVLDFDDDFWVSDILKYNLFLNRAGRKFLEPGAVQLSFWPHLFARIKTLFEDDKVYNFTEIDVIRYFLEGPAVMEQ